MKFIYRLLILLFSTLVTSNLSLYAFTPTNVSTISTQNTCVAGQCTLFKNPTLNLDQKIHTVNNDDGYQTQLRPLWQRGSWGTSVGVANIVVADIDGNNTNEIVTAGGYQSIRDSFWYIASYIPQESTYKIIWRSKVYSSPISDIIFASDQYNKYLFISSGDGLVEVYSSKTKQLVKSIQTLANPPLNGMIVTDIDNDNYLDIVIHDHDKIYAYDLQTSQIKWQTAFTSYDSSSYNPTFGNVDNDPAIEIIAFGYVIDGNSGQIEWEMKTGFSITTSDIDNDGKQEVITGVVYDGIDEGIFFYDVDTKTKKFVIPYEYSSGIESLLITNADQDNEQELVIASSKRNINVYNINTKLLEWYWSSPEQIMLGSHGFTIGDPDNDGVNEFVFGTSTMSTDQEGRLIVFNFLSKEIEFMSVSEFGPFNDISFSDTNNDGVKELTLVPVADGWDSGKPIFSLDPKSGQTDRRYGNGTVTRELMLGAVPSAIYDVNNDGFDDVLISGNNLDPYGDHVQAFSGKDGSILWTSSSTSGSYIASIAVGDIDNDGIAELVTGDFHKTTAVDTPYLRVYSLQNGQQMWSKSIGQSWQLINHIEIANIDNDPQNEILLSTLQEQMYNIYPRDAYIVDGSSHFIQGQALLGNITTIHSADVNPSIGLELLLGTSQGEILVYNPVSGYLLEIISATSKPEWIQAIQKTNTNIFNRQYLLIGSNSQLSVYDLSTDKLVATADNLGYLFASGGRLAVNLDQNHFSSFIAGGSAQQLYGWTLITLPPFHVYLPTTVR